MKKIFFSVIIFLFVLSAASALKIKFAQAYYTIIGHSWVWGGSTDAANNFSGIGWVSLSCKDLEPSTGKTCGNMQDYKVHIPANDAAVGGRGWIENLQSFIDFQPSISCAANKYPGACDAYPSGAAAGSTTASDVQRIGNKLVGWARIEGIAAEKTAGNSGGEDGWVSFNYGGDGYNGITIDPIAGTLSKTDYAWAGNTLGALQFYDVEIPGLPQITVTPNRNRFYLTVGQNVSNIKDLNVAWTAKGQNLTSCKSICSTGNCANWTDGNWQITNNKDMSGTKSGITLPNSGSSVTFTLECSSCVDTSGGQNECATTAKESFPVEVGCQIKTCGGANNETCAYDYNKSAAFFPTTDFNAEPKCKGGCQTDEDCKLREGQRWREVAPQQ